MELTEKKRALSFCLRQSRVSFNINMQNITEEHVLEKLDYKRGSKTSDIQSKGRKEKQEEEQTEGSVHSRTTVKSGLRPARWQSLHSHLDTALHQWNEISTQMEGELAPDQKQLQEVKSLLQQLKTKLEQF